MIRIAMIIAGLFCSATVNTQEKGTLRIVVNNIRDHAGKIHVAIYNSEDTFLETDHIFADQSAEVNNESELVITIENLEPGTYGLSLFHDVNNNGELDKNFMGIPKEPFGFGNDSMGAMGPPSFENASVKVAATGVTSTNIRLKSIF